MLEKKQYEGFFWLPSENDEEPKKEDIISGNLIFDPLEGIELKIIGSFNYDRIPTTKYDIILGETTEGKKLSLINCREIAKKYSHFNMQSSKYSVEKIFEGIFYKNLNEIKFDAIKITYSNLNEWLDITGFEFKEIFNAITEELVEKELRYIQPEPINIFNNEEFNINISFFCGNSFSNKSINVYELCEKIYFDISLLKDNSFNNYIEIIKNIRRFLTLATLRKIHIIELYGLLKDKVGKENKYIKIYYRQQHYNGNLNEINKHEILFSYNDIIIQNVIENFFNSIIDLEPLYNLYFSSIYSYGNYIEQEFLLFIQAIDGFIEYKTKTNNLKNRLPKELQVYKEIFHKLVDEDDKNFYKITERIKDSRDYYSHRYIKDKSKAATDYELIELTQILKILSEIFIFGYLGFDKENIIKMIFKRYPVLFALHK